MVVASTWGGGWLSTLFGVGYMDFAGSGRQFGVTQPFCFFEYWPWISISEISCNCQSFHVISDFFNIFFNPLAPQDLRDCMRIRRKHTANLETCCAHWFSCIYLYLSFLFLILPIGSRFTWVGKQVLFIFAVVSLDLLARPFLAHAKVASPTLKNSSATTCHWWSWALSLFGSVGTASIQAPLWPWSLDLMGPWPLKWPWTPLWLRLLVALPFSFFDISSFTSSLVFICVGDSEIFCFWPCSSQFGKNENDTRMTMIMIVTVWWWWWWWWWWWRWRT